MADKAHKNHKTTETEKRIYFKFEDFWIEVDAATKVTLKTTNQTIRTFDLNRGTNFSLIISAVSNISSVTLKRQGQQTDFWNVPCELHSM